jgi:putative ABC transport system permease protein
MAYSVTRRTKEIGIRSALGAEQGAVLQLILRQGIKVTALGVAIGLMASLAAARLIGSLLYVSPRMVPRLRRSAYCCPRWR